VPDAALAGDIVQFNNYRNKFTFCFRDNRGGWRWLEREYIRGPLHTAMVAITQSHTFKGQHLLLESHLHEPGVARMTIRSNRVYDDNFAVALTTQEFASLQGTTTWPASVDNFDSDSLARNVIWLTLRDDHPFPMHEADAAIHNIMLGHMPRLSPDIVMLCRLKAEKQRVMDMMIRSGRPGDRDTPGHPLDEYGSDNKMIRQTPIRRSEPHERYASTNAAYASLSAMAISTSKAERRAQHKIKHLVDTLQLASFCAPNLKKVSATVFEAKVEIFCQPKISRFFC
jgi:hypothetical protein